MYVEVIQLRCYLDQRLEYWIKLHHFACQEAGKTNTQLK